MEHDLNVYGDFDGGNPQEPGSIVRLAEDEFAVYPFSEDGDGTYKFRLGVVIANNRAQPARINLKVHWDDEEYIGYRDVVYIRSSNGPWRACKGNIDGGSVELEVDVPVGRTHLTLNPAYGYEDCLDCVRSCQTSHFLTTEVLVRTVAGRDVWLVKRGGHRSQPTILVLARTHPYETAGSFCVEGILRQMERNGKLSFRDTNLYVIPMVCADGVVSGMCKLDRVGGDDLALSEDMTHPVTRAQCELVDAIRPDFVLDFHNWMIPDYDGLFYERPMWMRRFTRRMERRVQAPKPWQLGTRWRFFARRPNGVKAYAQRRCRSRCMTVEFPWRARTPDQMMRLGVDTMDVLTELIAT